MIDYSSVGHIPKGLKTKIDASKRKLLNQLPGLLSGYGKTPNSGTVVVICDLDDKDKDAFLGELNDILRSCAQQPSTYFCLAIEELEAWYLGDLNAIYTAYPSAKRQHLTRYVNDAICGTWELLADAIYAGGSKALKKHSCQVIGLEKSRWAEAISPNMNIANNLSPSFQYLRDCLRTE